MYDNAVIEKTWEFVKGKLEGESSGHDWWHIYRVYNNAKNIAMKEEHVDMFVIELGALLHDIADWKFNDGDHLKGAGIAEDWLKKLGVHSDVIKHVFDIISDISYRGAGEKTPMKSKEGMIVQDADRLDAIGAIGIGRTFAYGGYVKREMYNPNKMPVKHETFEQYKKSNGTTVNHFYEKLLLLKDSMNTDTAKDIAQKRHEFMENFLEEFYQEWEGKK